MISPPINRPAPVTYPMATRISGVMRLFSNEYFTKNATPRNSASPPIHANNFTPMNCSQSIAGNNFSGSASSTRGGGRTGYGGGFGGGGAVTETGGGTTTGAGFGGSAAGGTTGGRGSRSRHRTRSSVSRRFTRD